VSAIVARICNSIFKEPRHTSTSPRRNTPGLCRTVRPKIRGRRESRVPRCTRSLACEINEHTSVVTTGPPDTPGLPCAMVLTAYSVLSPVTGLFCHRRLRGNDFLRKLDASVGAPGPHGFALRRSVARLASLPRPPHPASTFVTTRTPLLVRTGRCGGNR
jgi:hypothetical protein